MSNQRITAWLSEAEAKGIRDLAEKKGTSMNWMMRIAVRNLLGLPIRKDVTLVTRNEEH
jgi:hypothetical protein